MSFTRGSQVKIWDVKTGRELRSIAPTEVPMRSRVHWRRPVDGDHRRDGPDLALGRAVRQQAARSDVVANELLSRRPSIKTGPDADHAKHG